LYDERKGISYCFSVLALAWTQLLPRLEIEPQIDTLDSQVLSFKDKSDHILKTSSKFSYYNSLIQSWERIKSEIDPELKQKELLDITTTNR